MKNQVLPELLKELELAETIGCKGTVQNQDIHELMQILKNQNYWREQYNFQINSVNRFQLTSDKYYNQSLRLKEIIKNLIYSIDGEFVSEQLSNAAESAEEELQLMEINN